jgi:hypothetical protein
MFDSRPSASVDVSDSNEYCFTQMVNARRHGMFNQQLKNLVQYNKRINLATLAQDSFLVGTSPTQKTARYARCYTFYQTAAFQF